MIGCSENDWGTLEGVVQLNGAPVGPGTVMLAPVEGTGPGAMGMFGEDGLYSVMSSGRKEGAPPGEYRVTIRGGDSLGEGANPQPKTSIPPRYAQADLSNLTVRIEPGANTKDFQLEP
jgi:hypothetical protein